MTFIKVTQSEPPPPPKPIRCGKPRNILLDKRVKELIQYAETPEEIDVLVDAYKKIFELNKRYSV